MKNQYHFIAVLEYAEDGISIFFPDLPGCLSCADDDEGAMKNAKEAMGLYLFGMEQDGDEIPEPSALHSLQLGPGQVASLVEVFMPPVRDRINSRFVKKTLSLPAWLSSMADQNGVNCSKLFQKALMDYLEVPTPRPPASL